LPISGYEELVRYVNADSSLEEFVNNKARYEFNCFSIRSYPDCGSLDYDSYTQQLILRMPTTVHETFIEQVVDDILYQLRTLGLTSKLCAI
jgi:hypothetical protein